MGKFLEEIGEKIPTFVGIKFTSNNLEEGYYALKADSGRFAIFLGNDLVDIYFNLTYSYRLFIIFLNMTFPL